MAIIENPSFIQKILESDTLKLIIDEETNNLVEDSLLYTLTLGGKQNEIKVSIENKNQGHSIFVFISQLTG